jgi:hypothetical protein
MPRVRISREPKVLKASEIHPYHRGRKGGDRREPKRVNLSQDERELLTRLAESVGSDENGALRGALLEAGISRGLVVDDRAEVSARSAASASAIRDRPKR